MTLAPSEVEVFDIDEDSQRRLLRRESIFGRSEPWEESTNQQNRNPTTIPQKVPAGTVLILRIYRNKIIPPTSFLFNFVNHYVSREEMKSITHRINELYRFYKYRLLALLLTFVAFTWFFLNALIKSSSKPNSMIYYLLGFIFAILFLGICFQGNHWILERDLDQFLLNQNQHIFSSRECHWGRNRLLIQRKQPHPLLFLIQHHDLHPLDSDRNHDEAAGSEDSEPESHSPFLSAFNPMIAQMNRLGQRNSLIHSFLDLTGFPTSPEDQEQKRNEEQTALTFKAEEQQFSAGSRQQHP